MAQGKAIEPEIRAQVIAELIAGAQVSATAKKYKLGYATVHRLRDEIAPEYLDKLGDEKRHSVEQLLVNCVTVHLESLNRFVSYVCTPDYLKGKEPHTLATLYEKLAVTPLSILEAASAAGLDGSAEADNGTDMAEVD